MEQNLSFMKKILVPIDFSEVSINALQVAGHLALRSNARLFVLHVNETMPYVVPMPEYAYTSSAVDLDESQRVAVNHMEQIKTDLLSEPLLSKLQVETLVEEGLMMPVVRSIAVEQGIDLIVVGTLGSSGWKELLVGSNTERMIRLADCPVLVIPEGVKELDIKKILVPSTLKADQLEVFRLIRNWQDILNFEVEVLYINDPLHTATHGSVEMEKNRLTEMAGLKNVFLHIHGQSMNEESVIQGYANSSEVDLIVMGTHQRRGLSHLLFGSMTEDTANHTHVPVLAVPI